MLRRSNLLVVSASVAGMIAAGTVAVAQGSSAGQQPSAAEARLGWAKRHVELVCRPLEDQKMFDRATRCYNDVARLMGASPAAAPAATAEAPAAAAKATPETSGSAPTTPPAAKPSPALRPAPVRTAAPKPAPVRIAAAPTRLRPLTRPVTVARSDSQSAAIFAPTTSRCSGVSCLRYTLLGVGF